MTFPITGPSNKPMIQEAQNMMNNGGGGNLGYFQREEQEEQIKFKENEEDIFQKTEIEETLEIDCEIDLLSKILKLINKIKDKICSFFKQN